VCDGGTSLAIAAIMPDIQRESKRGENCIEAGWRLKSRLKAAGAAAKSACADWELRGLGAG
jgi:hypothetical protein